MRILHTSDWHLGRSLYNRKRHAEFQAFLDWLADAVAANNVDALIIAGDVFDTGTPGNRSQEMYYRFLCRMTGSSCRHVVAVAGNHDSATFLDAPKELLKVLDIHVVGGMAADPADEVIILRDAGGAPELVVCAVPYLRDCDVRESEAGESGEDKERKLQAGIHAHYAAVVAAAVEARDREGDGIPIVATGHLFAAGGQTSTNDGVRELYIGSLSRVTADAFPPAIDYLALGHLHAPQKVSGSETRRYSGSPLPMSFDETERAKSVCLVEFGAAEPKVTQLPVPEFQRLERVRGSWEAIAVRIAELSAENADAWLEVTLEGGETIPDLRGRLEELTAGTALAVVHARNGDLIRRALEQAQDGETLDDLDETEVFDRFLADHDIPEAERSDLRLAHGEILQTLRDTDIRAD